MKLNEIELKKMVQGLPPAADTKGKNCPSDDEIIESFTGNVEKTKKLALVDHLFRCRTCFEKFSALKEIFNQSQAITKNLSGIGFSRQEAALLKQKGTEKIRQLQQARKRSKGISRKQIGILFSKPLYRYFSMAALFLLCVIGGILVVNSFFSSPRAVFRGDYQTLLQLREPQGLIIQSSIDFKWKPMQKLAEYQVCVMDEELTRFWKSDRVNTTEIRLPAEMYEQIIGGKLYYWKVTAFLPDGTTKESNLTSFELKK